MSERSSRELEATTVNLYQAGDFALDAARLLLRAAARHYVSESRAENDAGAGAASLERAARDYAAALAFRRSL